MKMPNRRPWLFVLLTVLILLAGGMAVGMAARLVVVPQADQTVEVDTPDPPSFISQSMDEVMFYPWTLYDPDSFSGHLPEGTADEFWPWCTRHLSDGATLLGLTLDNDGINRGLIDYDLCFWKDCPAHTQDGQPVLLDVAYGADTWNRGWTWVARSTGEPPTRAQKEAAVAKVQEDVCALFDPQGQTGDLSMALDSLYNVLEQSSMLYQLGEADSAEQDWYASEAVSFVYVSIPDIAASLPSQAAQSTQQQLNALSQAAQDMGYRIQLVPPSDRWWWYSPTPSPMKRVGTPWGCTMTWCWSSTADLPLTVEKNSDIDVPSTKREREAPYGA